MNHFGIHFGLPPLHFGIHYGGVDVSPGPPTPILGGGGGGERYHEQLGLSRAEEAALRAKLAKCEEAAALAALTIAELNACIDNLRQRNPEPALMVPGVELEDLLALRRLAMERDDEEAMLMLM